jgi:Amt family ammonium transporter
MYGVGAAPLASLAATIPLSLFFVFQMVFAVVTPAIIIGSVADRWGWTNAAGVMWCVSQRA